MPMTDAYSAITSDLDFADADGLPSSARKPVGPFLPGNQTTLRQRVQCSGIGLHSGKKVSLALSPALAGTGIRFLRTDLSGDAAWIEARWDNVIDTQLCTVIGNSHGTNVGTIEHLMAALCAAGVDNAIVELDAPELPAMDGSSAPFLFLIECAGLAVLKARRRMLHIRKPVRVSDGEKFAVLEPCSYADMDVEILFDNPVIGRQRLRMALSGIRFKSEMSRARTFGFAHEVEYMRQNGLARGGSLDNAVVVDGDAILNPEGLRYHDEFVRHKALDAVGDLYLAGGPIVGRFVGHQTGHKLNNLVLRALFDDSSAYEWVDRESATPAMAEAERISA